jgi:hypothetical protein
MLALRTRLLALLVLLCFVPAVRADDPTDNPVATFYSGPEGYPAWTDALRWSQVINMKTYKKGKNDYEKFMKARDEIAEGGGILYYPAGTYDFTTMPAGVGLMLGRGTVIRGEAPAGHPLAGEGKLDLPTKFVFNFRERVPGGKVPRDWNFIGLQPDDFKNVKSIDQVGIAWVHIVGATIEFTPQTDWGKTWASANSLLSDHLKGGWGSRDPSGSHPIDTLAGGGKKYQGAGRGRLVFGCVLEDAAVLDDYYDPGYGPNGFQASPHCARIIAYGSRVFVANNLLPRSRKNFKYKQTNSKCSGTALFDYGRTIGIDVNKELLAVARDNGNCPGYFEEGVVVRDNYVFNHGHKGYSISGKWVTVTGNRNERVFLRGGDDPYGLGGGWTLTSDGYTVSGPTSDNQSRAFDLAGRDLWIDGNHFNNTGSFPGGDGEGVLGREADGTPIHSWAITHNVHTRGTGAPGSMGGADAECRGLLIAWNQTAGWVGNAVRRKELKMTDCAFVANKAGAVVPAVKTVARLGLRAPLTAGPGEAPPAPTRVRAIAFDDAVTVTWDGASDKAVGFRVERRIGDGKWQAIAYRPPQLERDPENPPEWMDFTAPTGKELTYRVVAIGTDDGDKGASTPSEAVTLSK